MPLVACLHNVETGEYECLLEGQHIDADDPKYAEDVHVIPVTGEFNEKTVDTIGYHTMDRKCICGPRIEEQLNNRNLIWHKEAVN